MRLPTTSPPTTVGRRRVSRLSNLDDPRVLFAAERTLMAWSRTAAGLMAFGFLVDRTTLLLGAGAPRASSRPATG
jgi:uncharacterized membrane protein YidH (DUF202 family)